MLWLLGAAQTTKEMAAAGHTCSNCKAPLSNEPLPPPRPPTSLPEVVDDQFVVVLDALGGSDPFAETGGGGAPETAAEAIQRCLREHRRGAADDSDPVCARCCARAAAAVDGRAADARARALKYARAVGEASLPDPPASIDTTDRDAVALALDRARREARLVRRQLDVVQAEARQLEAEESVVLEAARSLDEDVDAFGEFCDETVGRCARRRRRDGALEVLRRRIDAIEIDRAPFERIDAYVRAACARLAPGGDEPVPFVEES